MPSFKNVMVSLFTKKIQMYHLSSLQPLYARFDLLPWASSPLWFASFYHLQPSTYQQAEITHLFLSVPSRFSFAPGMPQVGEAGRRRG